MTKNQIDYNFHKTLSQVEKYLKTKCPEGLRFGGGGPKVCRPAKACRKERLTAFPPSPCFPPARPHMKI